MKSIDGKLMFGVLLLFFRCMTIYAHNQFIGPPPPHESTEVTTSDEHGDNEGDASPRETGAENS